MALSVDEIITLLQTRGQAMYGGEAVSQLDHALQCAHLAELAGETPETVAAALLHDLGHMIARNEDALADDIDHLDDLHQYAALPFLRPVFPEAVLAPIRLHVDAKRYLCAIEPGYWDTLSAESKHSLELQGGIFTSAQMEAFEQQPHAHEAARLRRYDDLAKTPGRATPGLPHYRALLQELALN